MAPQYDRLKALTQQAQERIFRLAARDYGLSLQQISLDANVPYNTVRSWAGHNGDIAVMSVAAVNKLVGVIPDDLLSHLFKPSGRCLVSQDDYDLDEMGEAADDVAAAVRRARHPMSDGGVEITEDEAAGIKAKAVRLRRVA